MVSKDYAPKKEDVSLKKSEGQETGQ